MIFSTQSLQSIITHLFIFIKFPRHPEALRRFIITHVHCSHVAGVPVQCYSGLLYFPHRLHGVGNPVNDIDCSKSCWEDGSCVDVNGVGIDRLEYGLQRQLLVQRRATCMRSCLSVLNLISTENPVGPVQSVRHQQLMVHPRC